MSDEEQRKRRERAIALQYSSTKELPRILASGSGEIAKKIVALAEKHNIPITEDDSLAEMLSKLDIGSDVSSESFRLVAEVLAFLYHTDKEWREEHPHLAEVIGDKKKES